MCAHLHISTVSPTEGCNTPAISVSPYTTDVFSRLEDGSYKEYLLTFSPEIPTIPILESMKEWAVYCDGKYHANIELLRAFGMKEQLDFKAYRHQLDEELKKSVKSYDKLWLLSKRLRTKKDNPINGEYIFMRLQHIQMNITKINLLIQLHDYYYPSIVKIVDEYTDPYNDIPSIKRQILEKIPVIFNEFYDCLLKIQYLDSVMSKLDGEIRSRMRYKTNHNYKFRIWCNWKGIS